MYSWHFQILNDKENFDPELVEQVRDTFADSFAMACSTQETVDRLKESQMLGLLKDETGRVCGCSLAIVPSTPFEDKYLVWGNGGFLRKTIQDKMLWLQMLGKITELFPERTFGWLGCRTQNPIIVRIYSSFGMVYPFQAKYSEGEGGTLLDYLIENIPQLSHISNLNRDTGICRAVYSIGRMGDYQLNPNGKIEQQLAAWDFNYDNGDCVIIVAKLPSYSGS